jgi:ATP-dependent protease HslVU (ClpYQ) peptidase subunit
VGTGRARSLQHASALVVSTLRSVCAPTRTVQADGSGTRIAGVAIAALLSTTIASHTPHRAIDG